MPSTTTRRTRAQAGFTLIELMVALVVSGIVMLGVFAFSSIMQSNAKIHQRNVRVQQALEGAMWTIATDLRHAGLGFARTCSELRVWDASSNRLINPGADNPALVPVDAITGEPYWVLRDGVQAHWDSNGAGEMVGPDWPTSASPRSAGDSFDVIMADGAYLNTYGVFTLAQPVTGGDTSVVVQTSALLDNGNAGHLAQVQQLFPPGTFFVISRPPPTTGNPFRPERQGQCALLQITGDVTPGPGSAQDWSLPVANISGFNRNLAALLENDDNGDVDASGTCPPEVPSCDDWNPTADNVAGSTVLPLGRLRWSRYEIDYTIPTLPYLVRYDIIGYQEGIDPDGLGGNGTAYPYCTGGACPGPQLHLPGGDSPPRAVAVGPMIEDMQVAVGCDGYTAISAGDAPMGAVPAPDLTFEEVGSAVGPLAGAPNNTVDENPSGSDRDRDEWLGNARAEQWAPDCVWHGTAQYAAAGWLNAEGTPARSRMSPQSIRVTLVGSSEFAEEAGGLSTLTVLPVEDRPGMESSVGARQRFTLTERFTPDNLRWRDPSVQ